MLIDGKSMSPRRCLLFLVALLAAAVAACQWPADRNKSSIHLKARPWPAADRLFHQDARWLGADDVHSVELENGRVLWLFGDTFIDLDGSGDRSRADFIHNSIAIQTGSDPSSAAMVFSWRQSAAQPAASFFPGSGKRWYWPGDGMRIGSRLLVFLTAVEPFTNHLGFTIVGWQAVLIENPHAPPGKWQILDVRKRPGKFGVALGTGGVLCRQGYLYAYGTNPGGNQVVLARWREEKAGAGDLREPEWWCGGALGWRGEAQMDADPAAFFPAGQAEFGVHVDSRTGRLLQIQTNGFGAANLGFRMASLPEGPWGPLIDFYSPEEKSIPGILIYAAKTHPFLTGADLVVTYATNHIQPQRILEDPTLYYPRFLKVDIQ